MRISIEGMAKLIPPPIQIFDEACMRAQGHIVSIHQSLGFEPEMPIRLTEDNEQRDLRQDSAITRRALGRIEKDIIFLYRLQLGGHRWSPIRDAKVVIEHVKQVPESRALKLGRTIGLRVGSAATGGLVRREQRWRRGRWFRRRRPRRVEGLVECLVQIEFRGHAHAVARQLPAQVGQPEGGDAQGPDVFERVEAVEEARGDQVPEVLVREGVDLLAARDV